MSDLARRLQVIIDAHDANKAALDRSLANIELGDDLPVRAGTFEAFTAMYQVALNVLIRSLRGLLAEDAAEAEEEDDA